MDITDYTDLELKTITFQVSDVPIRIAGIIKRCIYGHPVVVLLYPERDNEDVNRTAKVIDQSDLLWLTCPFLRDKISVFEEKGYLEKISDFIMNDRDIEIFMKEAHANYYYHRKKNFRKFLGEVFSIDDNNNVFFSGIGGIRHIETLNCLHQHYAHYTICENNVAGRVVSTLLDGNVNCKERICDNG